MAARPTALEAATAALARRDRSAADLAAYLERRGVSGDDARIAVERLRDAGYVNDARFAERRAEVLADRGHGDEAIRFELTRDGVGEDEIDSALAQLTPERDRALEVVGGAKSPAAGVKRLIAKGFSSGAIEAAAAAVRLDVSLD